MVIRSRLRKLFGIALAVAILLIVGGFIVWAQTGLHALRGSSRNESVVVPIRAFQLVLDTPTGIPNIPWISVLAHMLWLTCAIGVGSLVIGKPLWLHSLQERLLFRFAAGIVLLGLLVLSVGFFVLPGAAVWWNLLVAGAIATVFFHRRAVVECWSRIPAALPKSPWHWMGSLLLVLIFLALYAYALTPPVQSDGVRYHLAAPQEFLKAGRIVYLPLNAFSNFPSLPEMHFLIALATGAPEAAQLMHFTAFLFCILAVRCFCKRFVNRATATWAASLYLFAPGGMIIAAWPFTDHFVGLFLFVSFYALIIAAGTLETRAWVILGLAIGGGLGCKYTFVVFLPVLVIIGLIELTRSQSFRRAKTLLLISALVAAVSGGVWFAKTYFLTGNPVYPMAYSMFGGGDWSATNATEYAARAGSKGLAKTFANLFRSPWHATFNWVEFETQNLQTMLLLSLLTGFTGALIAIRERNRYILYAVSSGLAFYILWFFSYQSNRLLLPVLLFLGPAAAVSLEAIFLSGRIPALLTKTALLIAFAHSSGWALQYIYAVNPDNSAYLAGGISREQFLSRNLNYYRAFKQTESRVKPNETVLFIGEHRVFYARFKAAWSDWFDTPAVLHIMRQNNVRSARELEGVLRQRGIFWVLINEAELRLYVQQFFQPRFTPQEWRVFREFVDTERPDERRIEPGVRVFRL